MEGAIMIYLLYFSSSSRNSYSIKYANDGTFLLAATSCISLLQQPSLYP